MRHQLKFQHQPRSQHENTLLAQPPPLPNGQQHQYVREFNALHQQKQTLLGKASHVASMRSPRPPQSTQSPSIGSYQGGGGSMYLNLPLKQSDGVNEQGITSSMRSMTLADERTNSRRSLADHHNVNNNSSHSKLSNLPLQPREAPHEQSRSSQQLMNVQTLRTDSEFKQSKQNSALNHRTDMKVPMAFVNSNQSQQNAQHSSQQLLGHAAQLDTEYYEKHAYLMDDPSQKITDSMLQGRIKPNGNLESWAQSRSTNLLDSEDPSARLAQNSRSDFILNSRQDLHQQSLANHNGQIMGSQGSKPQLNDNILINEVRVNQGGLPDVSITDYLQPNDQSHISLDQNQKFHYSGPQNENHQTDIKIGSSKSKMILFHPQQLQANADNTMPVPMRTESKNSFKREQSAPALDTSNPDFVTVNQSADIGRQHTNHANADGRRSHNSSNEKRSRSGVNRSRSNLDRSRSQRSISSKHSHRSHKSQKSNMTENPMQYENSVVHHAPGFSDAESKQYRNYDQNGRNQNAFQQRAALAGIKHLQGTTYRQDSPIGAIQDRFPEKFSGQLDLQAQQQQQLQQQRFLQQQQQQNQMVDLSRSSNLIPRQMNDVSQPNLRLKVSEREIKLGSFDHSAIDHHPMSQAQSKDSRGMLSSQEVLENIFPEEMPEKPVQQFSGRSLDPNMQFHLSSSEKKDASSAREHLQQLQHHGTSPHQDHFQSLSQDNHNSHPNATDEEQAHSTSQHQLNYNNLMSMTQGVDQTIQILSNQGPMTQRTAAENQFVLEASFCAVSDTILQTLAGGLQQWVTLTFQDKLLQFTSMLQNMRKDLRLGGLIGIYQLIRGDTTELQEDILNVIIEEVFLALADYEAQEPIFIAASLEVIGFIGPNEKSYERVQVIRQLMCEPAMSSMQVNCMAALLQLGYEGLKHLIELATKDYNRLQPFILCNLLQIRAVQRVILTPSILSQLNNASGSQIQRVENLAMLNRLGQLVWEAGGLPILVTLIEEGNVDRQLVASVLRTSGKEGEAILLKLLKFHKNERVRMAAASVLSYRLPQNPYKIDLDMLLESQESLNDRQSYFIPGQVCRYIGPLTSLTLQDEDKTEQENYFAQNPVMEVNQRDFLASLHRMISLNNEYFIHQFDFYDERKEVLKSLLTPGSDTNARGGLLQNFSMQNVQTGLAEDPALTIENVLDLFNENQMYGLNEVAKKPINEAVIKTLGQHLLKEENTQVKEVVAAAIGGIGIPEAQPCLDSLIKNLRKSGPTKISKSVDEPAVRCMAVWAIGRLASTTTIKKASKILIEALGDPFFKVRASACSSIAQFGVSELTVQSYEFELLSQQVIPILVRLLRDGQLNKQTVAETIVLMGAYGEQTLVNIYGKEPECNLKLRTCIVRALALSNVSNASIDFVIEMLFRAARDKKAEIRRVAITSLDILRKKAVHTTDQVTYLKAKSLLPFLYRSLLDKDKAVRSSALLAITNFGPQGELMFIEGVTKEANAAIRVECAKGLGKIGPSTFRTLLLTLHDQDFKVKEAACVAILKNMTPESVFESFADKDHQKQSLLCSVQEVVMSDQIINLNSDIYHFLIRLSELLEDGGPNITIGNSQHHHSSSMHQSQQLKHHQQQQQLSAYQMFDHQQHHLSQVHQQP